MQRAPDSFFAVVEGLDGSGKTEVCRRVAAALGESLGGGVLFTAEPRADCCAGDFIRQALRHEVEASPRTLALAYAANRSDHADRLILPALSRARGVVLSDRYYLSSLVYQSGPDQPIAAVMALNARAPRPDVTLFFDVSAETCSERIRRRSEPLELFESRLQEMRARYATAIAFARERGERVEYIDANPGIEAVVENVRSALRRCAPEWLQPNI